MTVTSAYMTAANKAAFDWLQANGISDTHDVGSVQMECRHGTLKDFDLQTWSIVGSDHSTFDIRYRGRRVWSVTWDRSGGDDGRYDLEANSFHDGPWIKELLRLASEPPPRLDAISLYDFTLSLEYGLGYMRANCAAVCQDIDDMHYAARHENAVAVAQLAQHVTRKVFNTPTGKSVITTTMLRQAAPS